MSDRSGQERERYPHDPLGPDDPRSQRERMLAGDLYMADEPELVEQGRRAAELQKRYAALWPEDAQAARDVLSELLGALGADTFIKPPLYVDYGSNIRVGARTFANYGLVALDVLPITIGDDVQIGPNVQLLTPTHPLDPDLRRAKWEAGKPIVVGDNVWIGGGAIVLAGVTIGENSVVGAGAVVNRDVPPGVVVVGNPARVVRELGEGRGRHA